MVSTILVPLDGSPPSEQIVPLVGRLAPGLGAQLRLLHVVDTGGLPPAIEWGKGTHLDLLLQREQRAAEEALAKVAAGLPAGLVAGCDVAFGRPAEEIVARAERLPAELIAMSTRGRSGLARWVLGSVADRVTRTSPVPVLLHHPSTGGTASVELRRLVLPLDGSPEALDAGPVVQRLAAALRLPVTVVRVVPTDSLTFSNAPYMTAELLRELTQEAERDVLAEVKQLRELGIKAEPLVLRGDPAAALLDVLGRQIGALTVMSTHGRSGIARALLGSVTDRIIRSGVGPVIVVHPAPAEAAGGTHGSG